MIMIPTVQLAQSYKTVQEMMEDRGILNEDEISYMKGFGEHELGAMASKGVFCIEINKKVNIIYHVTKFKMQDFKPHIDKCVGFDVCILVVADALTTANLKAINEYQKKNDMQINLQIFTISEMLYNVSRHFLVPKHEVIQDQALAEEIIKSFNVKSGHQLPLLLKTDPQARYYGIKPGQLVRILRPSQSAGEYINYRWCV